MKFVPSPSASYSAPSKPFAFISFTDPALQPLSFHIVTKLLGGPPSSRSFPLHFFRFFRTLFALSPLSRTLTEKHRGYPPRSFPKRDSPCRAGALTKGLSRRSSGQAGLAAPELCAGGNTLSFLLIAGHWSLISVSALISCRDIYRAGTATFSRPSPSNKRSERVTRARQALLGHPVAAQKARTLRNKETTVYYQCRDSAAAILKTCAAERKVTEDFCRGDRSALEIQKETSKWKP